MWIFNGKPKRGSNQLGLYLLICLLSIQVLAGDGKVDLTIPISRAPFWNWTGSAARETSWSSGPLSTATREADSIGPTTPE